MKISLLKKSFLILISTGIMLTFVLELESAYAAAFTVTSTLNIEGACPGKSIYASVGGVFTLSAAIKEANSQASPETIVFISSSGVQPINLDTAFPAITGTPVFELNKTLAGIGYDCLYSETSFPATTIGASYLLKIALESPGTLSGVTTEEL